MSGVPASWHQGPKMTKGDENGRNDTGHRQDGSAYDHRPATHRAFAFDDLWVGRMGDVRTHRTSTVHSRWLRSSGLYPVSLKGTKTP